MNNFKLTPIPVELEWHNRPPDWKAGPDNRLSITAGAGSDWFSDPNGEVFKDNAPAALFTPPDAAFILSARVTVAFASNFDAGTFHIHLKNDLGAKLCFEYSPQKRPMIVTVVTRGVSDDCNSVVIDGNEVYLRAAVTPGTLSLHYSYDGRYWHLARYFTLGKQENLRAGFSAQSPTGAGCTAVFSEISYRAGNIKDIRSGE